MTTEFKRYNSSFFSYRRVLHFANIYEDLYEISCWFKIDRKQYARQSKVTENKYFIGIDWAEACNDVEEKFSENMKRNNQFDA